MHLYAEQYEEYEDGWRDWENAYHDKDNIGHIIDETIRYAENLVKYKKYYYARIIMDMVLKTNYTVIDEDIETNSKISLTEIADNNLILEDISTFCLYELYATYQMLGSYIDEIWNEWRKHFVVDKSIKTDVIKWLHKIIEKRVDAIMKGNYRTSYYKVALIVVAFEEMLSSQKLCTRNNYINYYIEKYPRRIAFRRKINELI